MAKDAHDLCHGRSYIFENLFWNLYSKFAYIFNSDFVSKDERAYYEAICGRKDPDHGANTLNFLSGVLYRCYNKLDAHGYTEKALVKLRERLTLP